MKTIYGKEAKHGDYVIVAHTIDDGWQKYAGSMLARVSNGKAYGTEHGKVFKEALIVIPDSLVSKKDKALIKVNIYDCDFVKFNRRLKRLFRAKRKELANS